MSITEGKKLGGSLVVFLHYPPVTKLLQCDEMMSVLKEEGIERCFYDLVSADYLKFCPKLIEKF